MTRVADQKSTGLFICMLAGAMTVTQSSSAEPAISETGIDHILYACSDLERGIDEIEDLLGVRPVPGGRHPQYGTHNALLSLGPGVYLEVIARDPGLPAPQQGALLEIPASGDSHLVTWALRVADVRQAAESARKAGIRFGAVESGSRDKPDGSTISWTLTDPYAMPMDGAMPILIDWGDTVHPSGVVPSGGELLELSIEHPDHEAVRDALSVLGAGVEVTHADAFRLRASIRTKDGVVSLQ